MNGAQRQLRRRTSLLSSALECSVCLVTSPNRSGSTMTARNHASYCREHGRPGIRLIVRSIAVSTDGATRSRSSPTRAPTIQAHEYRDIAPPVIPQVPSFPRLRPRSCRSRPAPGAAMDIHQPFRPPDHGPGSRGRSWSCAPSRRPCVRARVLPRVLQASHPE